MQRYRFALKPKWILGHFIALVFVFAAVNAGFWQLRRMHERQTYNDQVAANMEAPITPVAEVFPEGVGFDGVPARLNRRVSATGRYLVDQDLVINAQASPDGVPGMWIVTPLELDDGRILLVNRGWLPANGPATEPPADTRAPSGEVTVTGYISETQPKTEGESQDTNLPDQRAFLRIDIERIQEEFDQPVLPAFLIRRSQQPGDAGTRSPQNLAIPTLSGGPHLGYVMQWFGFTLVVLVGYPLLLWLIARDRERERAKPGDVDLADLPPGAFVDEHGVIDMTEVDRSDVGPVSDESDASLTGQNGGSHPK